MLDYQSQLCSRPIADGLLLDENHAESRHSTAKMYPAEIFSLFPPFPREDKVFVAMPFGTQFDARWNDVLKPGIEEFGWRGQRLLGHRVDKSRKGDSIIAEIVREIARSRLVIADVTTIGYLDDESKRPIRNANVLYEVGLAHSSRLPEEVILLRSDNEVLDFDISGVRVHRYNPNNVDTSRAEVQGLMRDALESVDLRRSIAVQRALQSLDFEMYALLQESLVEIPHPKLRTVGDVLAGTARLNAIYRLLSAAMFRADFKPLTTDLIRDGMPVESALVYRATEFGRTVFAAAREQQGFSEAFAEWVKTPQGAAWLNELVPAHEIQSDS